METPAQRLTRALKLRNRSIRSLHEELAQLPKSDRPPSTSYGSVRGYVKGTAQPSPEFLRAAAQVLNVDEKWLVAGAGDVTVAHAEATARMVAELEKDLLSPRQVQDPERLGQALGAIAWEMELRSVKEIPAAGSLMRLWTRWASLEWGRILEERSDQVVAAREAELGDAAPPVQLTLIEEEIAHRIGRAMKSAIDAIALDLEEMTRDELGDVIEALIPAVSRMIDLRRERARDDIHPGARGLWPDRY